MTKKTSTKKPRSKVSEAAANAKSELSAKDLGEVTGGVSASKYFGRSGG